MQYHQLKRNWVRKELGIGVLKLSKKSGKPKLKSKKSIWEKTQDKF